jgi:hypothetical protein
MLAARRADRRDGGLRLGASRAHLVPQLGK